MSDFTFLEETQVIGYKPLSIFKTYGTKATITDFATLLGGHTIIEDNERIGSWATKTPFVGDARMILTSGSGRCLHIDERDFGVRPAFYSSLKNMELKSEINLYGILEVEYGEYPQMVVSNLIKTRLENEYNFGYLNETGKKYTVNSTLLEEKNKAFEAKEYTEYEYEGSKYIRFISNGNNVGTTLSDGSVIQDKEIYWLKVEPVKWLVDEEENIALSKYILFSGIRFDKSIGYEGDFENTSIKKYINTYFSKDIVPSEYKKDVDITQIKGDFDYKSVTEDEIIKYAIESGVAVFLHGKSGSGKSDRVKELDKDSEIIYLRNATPDSLNGKSVFNSETNEMIDIPPTWYENVVKKCNLEPDKIHIVFFDEITNAPSSIQGMAFNIILNKEVNGIWKLPENARIVATGNDLDESISAHEIAEPLFNRFAHVYIETTVDDWLEWARTPSNNEKKLDYKVEEKHPKIHPAIYAYIAYKSRLGVDVLRTEYNGETPNVDPRKWEMSSRLLTYTNNPSTLRCLLGKELTDDFISFCKKQKVDLEEIENNQLTNLSLNLEEKYATIAGLSSVSVEQIGIVRDFIESLGEEFLDLFDTLWVHGDEERREKVIELKVKQKLVNK